MAVFSGLVEVRASRGVVENYVANSPQDIQPRLRDIEVLREMVTNDPVMSRAFDIVVDVATSNGFGFLGKNKRQINNAMDLFTQRFDFDRVIDNTMHQMLWYGDAYIELRKIQGRIRELWPLESTEMEIKHDKNGRIKGYIQKSGNLPQKEWPNFKPDEVIHLRLKWVGSQVYSQNPLKPVARSYAARILANDYVGSIFRNMPPKYIHVLMNASETDQKEFVANLRRMKQNPNMDLVISGEAKSSALQPAFDNGLIELLEYLRREVLTITGVPPVWVANVEGSNRSSSEAEVAPLEFFVRRIQRHIASQINRELLPRLGMSNLRFKFNPISLLDEKSVLENARQLKDMGFNDDSILFYLNSKGFQIPPDARIENKSVLDERGFKSRKRENIKTDNIKSELNRKGVSEKGKDKTTEQMNIRSLVGDKEFSRW